METKLEKRAKEVTKEFSENNVKIRDLYREVGRIEGLLEAAKEDIITGINNSTIKSTQKASFLAVVLALIVLATQAVIIYLHLHG